VHLPDGWRALKFQTARSKGVLLGEVDTLFFKEIAAEDSAGKPIKLENHVRERHGELKQSWRCKQRKSPETRYPYSYVL